MSPIGTFRTSRDVCVWSAVLVKADMRRPHFSAPLIAAVLSRWLRLLLENALHHTRADAKFPADLEDAVIARCLICSDAVGNTLFDPEWPN
jgi:hypothetical protein